MAAAASVIRPNGEAFVPDFQEVDPRIILWFDIDNTLYSKTVNVAQLMTEKIQKYFVKIGLSDEEAHRLHQKYYKEYGLAIRGLVRHHKVDPLDYNQHCDAALPLETILFPSPALHDLFRSIDTNKVRIWGLTNAFRDHASRVLKLLGLQEYFEGIVYCDYQNPTFNCKPERAFFEMAQRAPHPPSYNPTPEEIKSRNRFIDDSLLNIRGAIKFGWDPRYCLVLDEDGKEQINGTSQPPSLSSSERSTPVPPPTPAEGAVNGADEDVVFVSDLQDLRMLWKDVFL
ncbi:pyrimidine 5-nucleotidase [Atractiella rhizophila]|nr:pyrimidine 5-nucleotidase [Atractiella rhizophila]